MQQEGKPARADIDLELIQFEDASTEPEPHYRCYDLAKTDMPRESESPSIPPGRYKPSASCLSPINATSSHPAIEWPLAAAETAVAQLEPLDPIVSEQYDFYLSPGIYSNSINGFVYHDSGEPAQRA